MKRRELREYLQRTMEGATKALSIVHQGDHPELWSQLLGIQMRAARGVGILREEERPKVVVHLGAEKVRRARR